ncbi:two-component system sensor histidine kinase NtrB [Thalassolituus sp. LLYu03]|uniref:two-component system sensor histidine kinase NtrB n=1 Tax=Thalassolituus sp. LLYu03 TaxID=3421656 RepID=UPI003D298366
MILTRQKTMLATVLVCSLITLVSTLAYVFAADRVGRQHLAPMISDTFASLLQLQLTHGAMDLAALQSALETFCDHYQVAEAAVYNDHHERLAHCYENEARLKATDAFTTDDADIHRYDLHSERGDLFLILRSDLSLAEFFILDTLTTALFIVSIAALLIFLLYATTRRWQRKPYQQLLDSIRGASQQSREDERNRYPDIVSPDPDFNALTQELNDLLWQYDQRTINLRSAHQQAESARLRAIRLSNETRQINEHLAQEVSIRRGVENQLNNTQQLLDGIINAMPSALFTLDKQLNIVQCNQQAGEWLGQSPAQLKGRHLLTVLPELQALIHELTCHDQSHQVCKKERVDIISFRTPLKADLIMYPLAGQLMAQQVLRIDDISQRQQLEEVMVQSEKMTTVAGLATGIAHEINNPLGAILQNLQNIRRRLQSSFPANQEIAEHTGLSLTALDQYLQNRGIYPFMDNIQQAGERAAEIVANMLQFSRPDQHHKQRRDLNRLINDALLIARGDSGLRSVETEFLPAAEAVWADVLASEMEQVLLNLLQNAEQALQASTDSMLAHNRDWTPRIRISTGVLNGRPRLLVEDNGPGIPPALLSHIFEPFYTTKEIGKGTGLGLFVSYFIITSHHQGQIRYLNSAFSSGAAFEILLPPAQVMKDIHQE